MDLAAFKLAFRNIIDLIKPEQMPGSGAFFSPGFGLDWPHANNYSSFPNGYILMTQLLHSGAPELLRETIWEMFDTYKFNNYLQVSTLIDIILLLQEPAKKQYLSRPVPNIDRYDTLLLEGVLDRILSENNKSLCELLVLHTDYRKRFLTERLMYLFKGERFRKYFVQIITRSKKFEKNNRVWNLTYDTFIGELLACRDSDEFGHPRDGSYYGKLIKQTFPQKEIDVIAKRYCARFKKHYVKDFDYRARSTLTALWDFHPLIETTFCNLVEDGLSTIKNIPINIKDSSFLSKFYGVDKLSADRKRKIITKLYKMVDTTDRFDELAKHLSPMLGKENFQRLQLMR